MSWNDHKGKTKMISNSMNKLNSRSQQTAESLSQQDEELNEMNFSFQNREYDLNIADGDKQNQSTQKISEESESINALMSQLKIQSDILYRQAIESMIQTEEGDAEITLKLECQRKELKNLQSNLEYINLLSDSSLNSKQLHGSNLFSPKKNDSPKKNKNNDSQSRLNDNHQMLPRHQGNNQQMNGNICLRQQNYDNIQTMVYLVYNKIINGGIVQLMGGDRVIVGSSYKSLPVERGTNGALIHGDIYIFDRLVLQVSQIISQIKQDLPQLEVYKDFNKGIFIIGTNKSQKKTIHLQIIQLICDNFRMQIQALFNSGYSSTLKLSLEQSHFCQKYATKSQAKTQQELMETPTKSSLKSFDMVQQLEFTHSSPEISDSITLHFNHHLGIHLIYENISHLEQFIKRISLLIHERNVGQAKDMHKVRKFVASLIVSENEKRVCEHTYSIWTSNRIVETCKNNIADFLDQSFGTVLPYQENKLVIFSCAPVVKNIVSIRQLLKNAHLIQKNNRPQ